MKRNLKVEQKMGVGGIEGKKELIIIIVGGISKAIPGTKKFPGTRLAR